MRQFYYLCLYNPIAANMTHMITYPSGRCTEGALCARRGDTPPYKSVVYSTLRKDPPQKSAALQRSLGEQKLPPSQPTLTRVGPLWRSFTASRKDYHKALFLFKGDERREALSERSGGGLSRGCWASHAENAEILASWGFVSHGLHGFHGFHGLARCFARAVGFAECLRPGGTRKRIDACIRAIREICVRNKNQ